MKPHNAQLPKEISNCLYHQLLAARWQLSTRRLQRLRKLVREGYVPDYDNEAVAFAYLYFGVNHLKAFRAIQHAITPEGPIFRLLDLGCGSGASTVGAVLALRSWLRPTNRQLLITAADRNTKQLDLFRQVVAPWLSQLRGVSTEIVQTEAHDILAHSDSSWDVILCEYILEEHQGVERQSLFQQLEQHAKRGSQVVIIGSSQLTGHCEVEFLSNGERSKIALPMSGSRIECGPLIRLNRQVSPMYVTEA